MYFYVQQILKFLVHMDKIRLGISGIQVYLKIRPDKVDETN